MKYTDAQKQFVDIKIPQVWEKAVKTEKMAELLVYNIMTECMESFSDVSIEIPLENPVNAVLRSWSREEEPGFGTNAIRLTQKEDGSLTLECIYDIWKLREDIEVITDMFGTIAPDKVGEKILENDAEFPDEQVDALFSGIQKKRIPLKNHK